MNVKLPLGLIFSFALNFIYSQNVEELYQNNDFRELIKFSDSPEDLTSKQLFYVGYAFFQLENDEKAIEMYDEAISKGLDDDYKN